MTNSDKQYAILFYKYHPLTSNPSKLENYRHALDKLCSSLQLTGRILLGLSENGEGMNGTLAGRRKEDLEVFVDCMLGKKLEKMELETAAVEEESGKGEGGREKYQQQYQDRREAVLEFRASSRKFFQDLGVPELVFQSPNDFKWSSSKSSIDSSSGSNAMNGSTKCSIGNGSDWFPDLNIKIVKEIISSGGAFSDISTEDTSQGYLTPRQWHEEIQKLKRRHETHHQTKDESNGKETAAEADSKAENTDAIDTVLIDVRNHKECQIGSFLPGIAIDPNTKTFSQFPKWVQDHSSSKAVATENTSNIADTNKDLQESSKKTPSKESFSNSSQSFNNIIRNSDHLDLRYKKILLYCTGGIRCEKASAYIRKMVPQNKGVFHLKGGIHKYLEEFGGVENEQSNAEGNAATNVDDGSGGGTSCMFVGKNFVFDRRGAMEAQDCMKSSSDAADGIVKGGDGSAGNPTSSNSGQSLSTLNPGGQSIVGKCLYCQAPYDTFHPENVCTVCREPVLICPECKFNLTQSQSSLRGLLSSNDEHKSSVIAETVGTKVTSSRAEYHCEDHFHLKTCYYTNLQGFSPNELQSQLHQLQLHNKPLEGIGKKGKQRRRTLRKQMEKIDSFLNGLVGLRNADGTEKKDVWRKHGMSGTATANGTGKDDVLMTCRHCGSSKCASDCWGFHGGKARMVNQTKQHVVSSSDKDDEESLASKKRKRQRTRTPSNQRASKQLKRQKDMLEVESLQLCQPPSKYQWKGSTDIGVEGDGTSGDNASDSGDGASSVGWRVPPPSVRMLRSTVKGRWCGKTIGSVLSQEFAEFAQNDPSQNKEWLQQLIDAKLIRINGISLSEIVKSFPSSLPASPSKESDILLRNMDTIERIVHWHEPPVCAPKNVQLTKHSLPQSILDSNTSSNDNADQADTAKTTPLLYCINKPSTIPIYPAGPYCSNSLLLMVEAQEGLPPKTLIPCHRIDRATSGVLLCASGTEVARLVQGRMTSEVTVDDERGRPVKKLYLARVKGQFPASASIASKSDIAIPEESKDIASYKWCGDKNDVLEVRAPISVQLDASTKSCTNQSYHGESLASSAMMHRTVSDEGKQSISRFHFLAYDPTTNQSLISCSPITGRGHQLRVHLQLIGFPIHNDVEYGGSLDEEKSKKQVELAVRSISDVATECKSNGEILFDKSSVTLEEATSARDVCKCCKYGKEGIKAAFNTAQLLGGGHAIDLHALKYIIDFEQKARKDNKHKEQENEVSCIQTNVDRSMKFVTKAPSWASSFQDIDVGDLTWL